MRSARKYASAVVLGMVLMCACGKQIPEDIIQPDAMENLLYDYHLAGTMGNSLPYNETYKKEAYYEYVFRKHHVTQAEFDSSMIWYTRHSEVLSDIYNRLKERYMKVEDQLKLQAEKREGGLNVFLSGDSMDVWQGRSLVWLTTAGLGNKVAFDLKVDTTFHPMDRLVLSADFTWLPEKAVAGRSAVMALKFTFQNDSVVGKSYRITASGHYELELQPDSAYEFTDVSGFIHYNGLPGDASDLLVNRITLKRYHMDGNVPVAGASAAPKLSEERKVPVETKLNEPKLSFGK